MCVRSSLDWRWTRGQEDTVFQELRLKLRRRKTLFLQDSRCWEDLTGNQSRRFSEFFLNGWRSRISSTET